MEAHLGISIVLLNAPKSHLSCIHFILSHPSMGANRELKAPGPPVYHQAVQNMKGKWRQDNLGDDVTQFCARPYGSAGGKRDQTSDRGLWGHTPSEQDFALCDLLLQCVGFVADLWLCLPPQFLLSWVSCGTAAHAALLSAQGGCICLLSGRHCR